MDDTLKKEAQSQPPTRITKTWFIQKEDGEIFAINEKGAWDLLHNQNRNNLYSHVYKVVGVSDGRTYVETLRNSQNDKVELEQKQQEETRNLTRYINSLDRFKFEELLEDTDPKMIKVKELIAEKEKIVADLNDKLANITKTNIQKAFNAELEKARGHIEMPENNDVATPSADPQTRKKILNNLGL